MHGQRCSLLLIAQGMCSSQGMRTFLRELRQPRGSSLLLLMDYGVPASSIGEVSRPWVEAHVEDC